MEKVTAGILDFPRKTLPLDVWEYREDNPLPVLKTALRSLILRETHKRLSYFGATVLGINLYGGAAGYQYHKGGDIDCSIYIDHATFKGDFALMEKTFKKIEIPWGNYVLHLFVKPKDQPEQIEVADAFYSVTKDRWVLPPLILPKDFDPNVYMQSFVEIAETRAEMLYILMGKIGREWEKLKVAYKTRDEGARDPHVIERRVAIQKEILKDLIKDLRDDFIEIWTARKIMHDKLRNEYKNNLRAQSFARFQVPEVTWKYVEQSGYAEFLKVLVKAYDDGVIDQLMEKIK